MWQSEGAAKEVQLRDMILLISKKEKMSERVAVRVIMKE